MGLPGIRRGVLAALIAAGSLALAACGESASEGASEGGSSDAGSNSPPPPKGNGTDRAFATLMIPHHESAVEMAEIGLQRAESLFVRDLSRNIIRTQNAEIAQLRRAAQALEEAGVEKTSLGLSRSQMGMNHDASALEKATKFDRRFISMMIPHHEGAITMARAQLADGADAKLTTLAEDIITAQQGEIIEMLKHLENPSAVHTHH
jgi:uncharacterized protein (DUF305 family)